MPDTTKGYGEKRAPGCLNWSIARGEWSSKSKCFFHGSGVGSAWKVIMWNQESFISLGFRKVFPSYILTSMLQRQFKEVGLNVQ